MICRAYRTYAVKYGSLIAILLSYLTAHCAEPFELSLRDAENQALKTSETLKAAASDVDAATEQEEAGLALLWPRLSLQAGYQYQTAIPSLSLSPGSPAISFGSNYGYSVGPALNYTLWDTFSSLRAFRSISKLRSSRQQDRTTQELQLLLSLRSAYVRVQLALEELRLVNGSLDLARAQERDIQNRLHAGAATRLDEVISSRQVLGFELQFKQKQADLSSALKDLLAFVGNPPIKDLSHPGPPEIEEVSLVLKTDSLMTTLNELGKVEIRPPDDEQPQIRSQQLQAESADLAASSQTAKLFPTVQLSASAALAYPNGPQLVQINQNTIGLTLSMPLFLGDPTWHLAAEKRCEAESARHRAEQLKTNILRDFTKAQEMLNSLYEQKKLAIDDVSQSSEAAKLYYSSYKAGKNNLLDVQTANNQALQAKVAAARIDAQILNQLISLIALSGKGAKHA